jgi:hypothetical protein
VACLKAAVASCWAARTGQLAGVPQAVASCWAASAGQPARVPQVVVTSEAPAAQAGTPEAKPAPVFRRRWRQQCRRSGEKSGEGCLRA